MKRPTGSQEVVPGPPVADGSLTMRNRDGDRMTIQRIRGVCGGCHKVFPLVVVERAPVYAKFKCPACGYVTRNIKTRDEAMDTIEGHIEEGEFEQRMTRRKSVYFNGHQVPVIEG